MNDEREKPRTEEVIETTDQPAEGGPMVEKPASENRTPANQIAENRTPANTREDDLAPLFEQDSAEKFRTRWLAIQSKFVDDPGASVQQADDLVADVIQTITRSFADRRGTLEEQWKGGGQTSTEDLRLALKQYRSFFERLLSLQS